MFKATHDPYTRLRPGDLGTVRGVWPDAIDVRWDSGSNLTVLPGAGDAIERVCVVCGLHADGALCLAESGPVADDQRRSTLIGNLVSWLGGHYDGPLEPLEADASELFARGWMPPELEVRLPPGMVEAARTAAARCPYCDRPLVGRFVCNYPADLDVPPPPGQWVQVCEGCGFNPLDPTPYEGDTQ